VLIGVVAEPMVLATRQVAAPAEPCTLVWNPNPRVIGLVVPAQQEEEWQAAVGILCAGVVGQQAAAVVQVGQRDS
jgi:hypothetical protein